MAKLDIRTWGLFVMVNLLSCNLLMAQSQTAEINNALGFPSAENNFLSKSSFSQSGATVGVDLYTGTAQINVPIYTLASREIGIPISLEYVGARGIRVQDYASCVGLGWQLSAGGSITRVVRGFPDEGSSGYVGGGWGNLVNAWDALDDWDGSTGSPSLGNLTTAQGTALMGSTNGPPTADGEPDLFYISTPFFQAEFVWDGNGNPVFSNATGLSITFTNNHFIVTDGAGNRYYFGSTSNSIEKLTEKIYGTTQPAFTISWYLDKIITYNSHDVINLTYFDYTGSDITYHHQWTEAINSLAQMSLDSTAIVSTVSTPRYVSVISTSLGEADFLYVADREDDQNAKRLSQITIKGYNPQTGSNSTTLQKYTFNSSYFGSPSTDPDILRLRLDNITVTGNTASTSTPLVLSSFVYNQNHDMPTRRSQAFDYWGYCSNTTTAGYFTNPLDFLEHLTDIRAPVYNYAITDLLYSIKNVNGGSVVLNYELNDCIYNGVATPIGGLRVKKIETKLLTGETYYTSYFYDNTGDGTGSSTGQIIGDAYKRLVFDFGTSAAYLSESPFITNDMNGNYVGYSKVRTVNQNGGYTVSVFSNFNDPGCGDTEKENAYGLTAPACFISSTDASYKRGLLLEQTIYTSDGKKISQDLTPLSSYFSLTSPVSAKSKGFRPYFISARVNNNGGYIKGFGEYHTNVENYRLTQKVHRDYDQLDDSKYIERTETYSYSANNRLVKQITTTDSKGLTSSQTIYRAYDSYYDIPMMTTAEGTAQTLLNSTGKTDAILHIKNSRSTSITQMHNSYSSISDGTLNHAYLTGVTQYINTNPRTSTAISNSVQDANVIGTQVLGGPSKSVQYGYNSSYPVAVVSNASSVNTTVLQTVIKTGNLSLSAGYLQFTVSGTSTYFTLTISFNNYPGATNLTSASYTVNGTNGTNYYHTGNLCYTSGSYTCGSYTSSASLSLSPGSYSISCSGSTNYPSSSPSLAYSYLTQEYVPNVANEFYFESFEENGSATSGDAHSGNRYMSTSYTAPFNPSGTRQYIMQYWTLVSGKWTFHETPYSYPTAISGPVDDVRIFPTDALMTTYTYSPLVGKTSEMDPSGKITYYEYDGLGRLNLIRDQDKNIIKKYCYDNYLGESSCPAESNVQNTYNNSNTTWTVTLTNVLSGQQYNYSIPNSLHPTNTLTIPVGNYNLAMSPGNSSSHLVSFDGYTLSGNTASAFSLTGIPISSDVIFNITY